MLGEQPVEVVGPDSTWPLLFEQERIVTACPRVRRVHRIAALADGVVAAAERALPPQDHALGCLVEHEAWSGLLERPAARQLMTGALTHGGAQTVEGERNLGRVLRSVATRQA